MPHHMSKGDSSRIQSTQATGGRDMSSGGFAARAQSAGDRNTNTSGGQATGGGYNSGTSGFSGSGGNTGGYGNGGSNKK